MIRYLITGELIIDMRARGWCRLPYPGHPKGCPNYGKSPECPPRIGRVGEVFDLTRAHWFVVEEFNIRAHSHRMGQLHPEWSIRQRRNCLYWQNGVRKRLRASCNSMVDLGHGNASTLIPEAMGVQVIETAQKIGIHITRTAFPIIYKIALVGYKK